MRNVSLVLATTASDCLSLVGRRGNVVISSSYTSTGLVGVAISVHDTFSLLLSLVTVLMAG